MKLHLTSPLDGTPIELETPDLKPGSEAWFKALRSRYINARARAHSRVVLSPSYESNVADMFSALSEAHAAGRLLSFTDYLERNP